MKFKAFYDETRGSPWGVVYTLDGKRLRRFFKDEPAQLARISRLEEAFAAGGPDGIRRMDVDLDLEKAKELAAADGRSVLELVQAGVAAGKKKISGPTLFEAFYGFEARGAQVGLRPKTSAFYAEQLGSLMRAAGEGRRVGDLTRAEIRAWIDAKPVRSRPHGLRAVKAWFRWMLRQEPPLVGLDPTAGMGLDTPIEERNILFLTGEQAADLLAKVAPEARAAVALMLFAGIRHNELHRDGEATGVDVLRWEDIDLNNQTITVRAEVAKTRVARTVRNAPANVFDWLTKPGKGPVAVTHLRLAIENGRRLAKISHWGKSILRHTCASHHAAAFEDLSQTALLIRHEGDVTLLNRRYREGLKISKAEGRAFFEIRPA